MSKPLRNFRQRGIASRLAEWRVEYVHQHMGDEAVILAYIQKGNTGSQKTAQIRRAVKMA